MVLTHKPTQCLRSGVNNDMTMRDMIAIEAMKAELSTYNYDDSPEQSEGLAEWCYQMADAMLAASAKGMH